VTVTIVTVTLHGHRNRHRLSGLPMRESHMVTVGDGSWGILAHIKEVFENRRRQNFSSFRQEWQNNRHQPSPRVF
jgi:hypothetical protein